MLEKVIEEFEIYRTEEDFKQLRREKQQIINTIKLFMVGGAEYFYLNYYLDDNVFINNTYIDKQEIKRVLDFAKDAEKHFDNGLLTEDEEIKEFLKYIFLTDTLNWEKENDNLNLDTFMLFRFIADCITGNIGYMFEMVEQIVEKQQLDYDLTEEAEMSVYNQIGIMFCHLGRLSKKYSSR